MRGDHIEEFEGNYGPIIVDERLLQRFWHKHAVGLTHLCTTNGDSLKIQHPGQWNFREGPDFLGARLTLNGTPIAGDVEIHFHAHDWFTHGHHKDPNYRNVRLHITWSARQVMHSISGYYPPHHLILMDFLHGDLESLVETDYLNQWISPPARTHNPERWSSLTAEQRRIELIQRAHFRFRRKVRELLTLQQHNSIEEICHQRFLEILGYPSNRFPFIQIARRFPLKAFHQHSVKEMWASINHWQTRGVRPASHPWKRLNQYWQFVRKIPDWPLRVQEIAKILSSIPDSLSLEEHDAIHQLRKQYLYPWIRHPCWPAAWNVFSSGLKQNLLINLLLPLCCAHTGTFTWPVWFAMPAALYPENYSLWLKQWEICIRSGYPLCNGWIQGAIHLFQHNNNTSNLFKW
jgi:hypothetical protein